MAANEFTEAVNGITTLRTRCEAMRDQCDGFRQAVSAQTLRLAAGVVRLPDVAEVIAANVEFARDQLDRCRAALAGASRGQRSWEEAAGLVNAELSGADIALNGVDEARDALVEQVDDTLAAITGLADANPDTRNEQARAGAEAGSAGEAAWTGRAGQGGGRRRGGRRRRRGGYTPTPCHKRCCGTGTRLNKKKTKCVARKRSNRSSRRRRK